MTFVLDDKALRGWKRCLPPAETGAIGGRYTYMSTRDWRTYVFVYGDEVGPLPRKLDPFLDEYSEEQFK